MTKMEILLKITPAVSIVRKLTPKMEEKRQNRGSLLQYFILYLLLSPLYRRALITLLSLKIVPNHRAFELQITKLTLVKPYTQLHGVTT